MADSNTVQYQINVTRTGEGASQAVADFQAVEAAVAKANTTVAKNTEAVNSNATANTAAKKQFDVFKGTLTLVAGQAFPQLTASVMVAKNAVEAMRASNVQMQAGFFTTSAALAGLAGMVLSAAAAWGVYRAEKQQATSESKLSGQETDIQKSLIEEIDRLEKEQELTKADARRLRNATGDSSGNRGVQDFIRYRREGNAQDRVEELRLVQELSSAEEHLKNIRMDEIRTEADRQAAMARVTRDNLEQIQLFNDLQGQGLMTAREVDQAKTQADIAWMGRLTEIKRQLTDLQQLQISAAHQFASGFAGAFVSFLDGTKSAKEAFQDFARSFLSQVAQMIMQQVILNALRNVGFAGLAQGGVRFAADGLTGVSAVSSPTYFPKFNVVAGEAGKEMLTVLARPRMMEVGGMQAVVGSAQGNRLAITSADALAQAGGGAAGGTIVIQVQGTPDFEARVISNSVKGAQVQVANDMRSDTPISRGVKGLTS